jgi:hypothetical protein
MAEKPPEFGKRRPAVAKPFPPAAPVKRSHHVALLLMGTFAIGSAAYALMPRENCQPGIAEPSGAQGTECQPRGSSSGSSSHGGSGGSSSRSSFYGGDGSGSSSDSSSSVKRGGFGSYFAAHFSGGG